MKKIFNYIMIMLIATGILLSCKEDGEETSEVMLFSFGPAGVEHGDKIKFIGLNLDRVTSISLPGIDVPSSAFTTSTSRLVEIVVPQEAEAGLVVLKTPDGDITTKTPLNFKVPVVLTSITPEARPGGEISIKGTLVNWIEEITFNDGISVTEFVSKSTTELKVNVPINAQTGFLIFKSGGTDPESFASTEELKVTLPAVTSLSPSSIRHTSNLTINGTNLDLVTSINFGGDKTVTTFVSKTATQIVVAVPAGTLKGKITLRQASPVNVVTTQELTIILPVATAITPKPAKPGIDNITITGTDLDLVKSLTLPTSGPVLATSFISHTATQIVLALPVGTKSGGITYTTTHDYSSNLGVTVIVPAPGPLPLNITMFDETTAPGGGDWSWNKIVSESSTEQFYSGDKSWKFETGSGGGMSVGGMTAIDASGMDLFSFSIFGGAGTNGKQVAAILNDNWTDYNAVTLVEGQWNSFQIDLSEYPTTNLSQIVRFAFKVESTASTIYVDRVGFEPAGPPPLLITLFDETPAPGGGDWSWNKIVSDMASTEQAYVGNVSWKFETGSGGGLSSGGITALDASGATNFTFALYGGAGTAGQKVAVILNDNWTDYNAVDIVAGQWTKFSIPLSSYPTTNKTAIVRFAFKVESTASVIYVDRVGFD